MKKLILRLFSVSFLFLLPLAAQPSMTLPAPRTEGGMPLMRALALRHSTRTFTPASLTLQQLSDLLWAACGVNRPGEGKRTAPSANNAQEIDLYVALPQGVYRYHGDTHTLELLIAKDLRASTGHQEFVGSAALNLLYVADITRMKASGEADQTLYSAADAGFIAQNVYLFCASEGLGTVVRGWIDREALAKALGLRLSQRIVLAQTVGVPK